MRGFLPVIAILTMVETSPLLAQSDRIDTAILSRIRHEGLEKSQVMKTLFMLTDVHGPRLTNSPRYFKAVEYAKSALESWGLQNVHTDIWDEQFGRGWELKKFNLINVTSGLVVAAYPKAWSPGIEGTVRAETVYLDVRNEEDLKKYRGKLKGKIILFGLPVPAKPGFKPDAVRLTDSALLVLSNAPPSELYGARRFRPVEPERLAFMKWDLCRQEGAIAILEPSPRFTDGIITLGSATVAYQPEVPYDARHSAFSPDVPKILPQIVVGAEHYNSLVRQVENAFSVQLELTLETSFTDSRPGVNVIGDIEGTDLKDEVVMLGAHLDSWHAATGTTDNAAGVAVMMEAMRILKSLPAEPRRTIRIGLWGGEEQGLLGSRNYVRRTLGQRLDKRFPYDSIRLTPAGEKFSVYFNSDLGTGKFRGIYLQSNEKARPVLRSWLAPFANEGTATLTPKNITGTDHLTFDAIGLPAFQFIQDPIEYGTTTYHSNVDFYDKAVEPDLKHNAVVMATIAWMAANRDGLFPRK